MNLIIDRHVSEKPVSYNPCPKAMSIPFPFSKVFVPSALPCLLHIKHLTVEFSYRIPMLHTNVDKEEDSSKKAW